LADKNFKVKNKLVLNGLAGNAGPLVADSSNVVDSTPYIATQYGGTGTTTSPSSGQVLYSASGTTYAPTAFSSLPGVYARGNTASRPESPNVGDLYYNSELNYFESYTSNGWFPIAAAPGIPTEVTATNTPTSRAYNNGRMTVAFTTPTNGGSPTSFIITPSPTTSPTTFTGSSSPITVTGLASSTQYTYTVAATSPYGTSAASSASSGVTATTVPQAPTIGTVTAGNAEASVSFTAGATGGSTITGYSITSSPASTTTTQSASSSPYTFTGLTNGTTYTFTVTATNANGTSAASSASSSITPDSATPDRAVFMGGVSSTYFASNAISNIDYLSISTTGNATNFGNLITARIGLGGFSSSTRSIIGGGSNTSNSSVSSIEYVTIASPGNATSFGNLTNPKGYLTGALSNDIYGMWYGGAINNSFPETAQMEYVTIATTGNGTLFGNLATTVFGGAVGAGNTTRGIITRCMLQILMRYWSFQKCLIT
jgi:hypothetical protein